MHCHQELEAAAILICFCGVNMLGGAVNRHGLLLDNGKAERWLYLSPSDCDLAV